MLLNSITSKNNLERRGVAIVSNLCCFCRVKVESTRHSFFECRVAWLVWNKCYARMGLTSVNHHDPVSHFSHFNLLNVLVKVNVVRGMVWIAVVGEIWKHRNKYIIKGGVIDHSKMFTLAQLKVWSWITSKSAHACFSYSEWCIDSLAGMFSIK